MRATSIERLGESVPWVKANGLPGMCFMHMAAYVFYQEYIRVTVLQTGHSARVCNSILTGLPWQNFKCVIDDA